MVQSNYLTKDEIEYSYRKDSLPEQVSTMILPIPEAPPVISTFAFLILMFYNLNPQPRPGILLWFRFPGGPG